MGLVSGTGEQGLMREFQFLVAWRWCARGDAYVSDLVFWDEQLELDIAMFSLMNQKCLFLFFFILFI